VVKTLLFGFATVALTIVSAATGYDVKFFEPVTVNGTKLEPGQYRVELNGETATLKHGKTVAEVPVKVENAERKYSSNTVRLEGDRVSEIGIGGTHTKLVFDNGGVATK
jgi:hypothetical protein